MNSSSPLRIRLQPKMVGVLVDLPLESVRGILSFLTRMPAPDLDVYLKVFGKWYTPILNPFEVKEFVGI